MKLDTKLWIKFSLVNLFLVALLGVLMRYKIGFEFPYFDQKNIQHSHSHFAFSGWISHTLMTLMVYFLQKKNVNFNSNRYKKIIILNLACAYGMLISFIFQGYDIFSIFFSTTSIIITYFFAYYFIIDLKKVAQDNLSKNYFKIALLFNVISSLGTFALAYMMATKNIHQNEYLASIYYYLHFQYNGWFFFACMGLLFDFLNLKKSENKILEQTFKLFFISCIPAYFLSTLWLELPIWLYIITVIATLTQTFAWFKTLQVILKTKLENIQKFPFYLQYLLLFVAFAVSVKFLLQLGSTIPSISKLAFGFRPIVIAYLHLVLLGIITLFLLFYIFSNALIEANSNIKFGLITFSIGVILNEIILAIQGIGAFSYKMIPYANEMLFAVALLLITGIGLISFFTLKNE